jgi:hypothetical protein
MGATPFGAIVKHVLDRQDVPIEAKDVPDTVTKVMTAVGNAAAANQLAIVPVKPSWMSKINIFNGGILATAAGWFGFNIPQTPEEWVQAIVSFLVPALTMVLRTWFSGSVTAASMPAVPPK